MTDSLHQGNHQQVSTHCLAAKTPQSLPALDGAVRGSMEPASSASSFDAFYERHFDFVWRCLRRLGVDSASIEDAAHDVFLVVHRQLVEFDGRNEKSWLFAIARRVAWHYRRALARRRTDPLCETHLTVASVSRASCDVEKREAQALVEQLLGELTEERRAVIVLSELEQMTMPEVAEILAIPLNTAYSRLRLARRDFSRLVHRYQESKHGGPR